MVYILPFASSRNNNRAHRSPRIATSDQGPISRVCQRHVQAFIVAAFLVALARAPSLSGGMLRGKKQKGGKTLMTVAQQHAISR
jgi:hypothetical protein